MKPYHTRALLGVLAGVAVITLAAKATRPSGAQIPLAQGLPAVPSPYAGDNIQAPGESYTPSDGITQTREVVAEWPKPIFTADEAWARSVELFPVFTRTITAQEIRLVTYDDFARWDGSPGDTTYDPSMPVWMVGLRADDLVVQDVVRVPGGSPVTDDRPCVGALYVWDAGSGDLVAQGAIMDEQEWQRVVALENKQLTIPTATVPRPLPTVDPTLMP